jgi:hypothetical protein
MAFSTYTEFLGEKNTTIALSLVNIIFSKNNEFNKKIPACHYF